MCMSSSPSYTPAPAPVAPPAPPKPMVSPEAPGKNGEGSMVGPTGSARKGRSSLKIDLASGGTSASGLNIPV